MANRIRHFLAVPAILAALAAMPVRAEDGASAIANGIGTAQDNSNVTQQVVQLKAQLDAVERETLRRLACQANPDPYGIAMVSTATGCQEVPGLRTYVTFQTAGCTGNTDGSGSYTCPAPISDPAYPCSPKAGGGYTCYPPAS